MFKSDRRHPDLALVLDPTRTAALRVAVDRLRMTGMSRSEAASEILRAKIYTWAESQSGGDDTNPPRLRPVKD